VYTDRGYDHDIYRRQIRDLDIRAVIARRGTEHGSGLGKDRWVVEAAFAPSLVTTPAHPLLDFRPFRRVAGNPLKP
jgi:hypothetical protein